MSRPGLIATLAVTVLVIGVVVALARGTDGEPVADPTDPGTETPDTDSPTGTAADEPTTSGPTSPEPAAPTSPAPPTATATGTAAPSPSGAGATTVPTGEDTGDDGDQPDAGDEVIDDMPETGGGTPAVLGGLVAVTAAGALRRVRPVAGDATIVRRRSR